MKNEKLQDEREQEIERLEDGDLGGVLVVERQIETHLGEDAAQSRGDRVEDLQRQEVKVKFVVEVLVRCAG